LYLADGSQLYRIHETGRSFSAPEPLSFDALPFAPRQVACADVNGDGVDDLVVQGASGTQIFQGVAVHP